MDDQLFLSHNDLIELIEHHLGDLHPMDLISIVNQFTDSWVQILPKTGEFVWSGGKRPSFLASVVESDAIQKTGLDN